MVEESNAKPTPIARLFAYLFDTGLPFVLGMVGIALVLAGKLLSYSQTDWPTVFGQIGGSILGAGIFAALMKSLQFRNIFREALSDIVYAEDFMSRRKDLFEIWNRVTSAIHNSRFPLLVSVGNMHNLIRAHYLPTDKGHYLSNNRRTLTIDWADKENLMISVVDDLWVKIMPKDSATEIDYDFWYEACRGKASKVTSQTLEACTVDGSPPQNLVQTETPFEASGTTMIKYHYSFKLKGRSSYQLYRQYKRTFSLENDPFATFSSATYILGCSIQIICLPDDLRVHFTTHGALAKFDSNGPQVPHMLNRNFTMTYEGLLFPRQGYILFYQKS